MPVSCVSRQAERWFRTHQRALPWRSRYDPYHVWVSEVMLQQTRMEVVLRYFEPFLQRFPTIADLARASYDEVAAAWSGLGYYRRARMLRDGGIAVCERFGGALPDDVASLRTIPGIGRYTAGAIASIAFDRPAPIVDGNMARLLGRLCGAVTAEAAWKAADDLVRAAASPRACNQALMEIGALICRTTAPACSKCPLRRDCAAFAAGRVNRSARTKTKPTRALRIPLYIVADRRGRILMRRHSGRLMGGIFHLPHGNGLLLRGCRLPVPGPRKAIGSFRHTVTNRRITFSVFTTSGKRPAGDDYVWIEPERLAELPHPSYVRKALQLAGISKI